MSALQTVGFLGLGLVLGAFGTLIGVGGGFLLLPLLLFAYPHEPPGVLTAISLAVVCANATTGSIAYARMRRIDSKAGLVFALAGIPGSVLGAIATGRLDRRVFDPLLGGALLVGAALIAVRPREAREPAAGNALHTLVEADGTVHRYRHRLVLGAAQSVLVGFVSSLLGIGGGVLHVPLMVFVLGFPVHIATATSHFVLAILTASGVAAHAADGTLRPGLGRALPLVAGVLAGAPFGARLSSRVASTWILRSLAVGLALVGLRLLVVR
ncbi:MAG TPA: sulfite exporter TauE/SafE family protein [Candidatus Eisenbacteria bacterium]|jgi:uncharacterized membrane protein YfcA